MKGGYWDKLLRVNLTKGECTTTCLPEESVLREYVGGIGLGMLYPVKGYEAKLM